ncbi:tyrosine-type recombinase/integrase [Alkalihalobacterium elongatum]|uniref:tyrosine-type recombinase/integrase n=1 Tax=Alkalihalobacterium elongatum TaxID=2675466 RepID=UPI001C1F506E|nr:site-specific integrase [Alkalihalobacterium elongatum]
MASIQQRGKKSFQYTVSHTVNGETTVFRKSGFKNRTEAKAAATELEARLYRGIVPHLKDAPIDEYFDNWVQLYKKGLSDVTLSHYKYTYERIKEHFGSKPLQEINKKSYQAFLNEFGENKAKETVEKLHGHIRECVQEAVEEQIIPRNFTQKANIYYTVLAKDESEKHLNYNDSKLVYKELLKRLHEDIVYYLLLLGLETGLRFAELVGLTFEDFDFDNNKINVDKTWGYSNKKKLGFGRTKKRSNGTYCDRIISVNIKTMSVFKDLFETLPDNKNRLVFYNSKSKYKVITNERANKLLKEVLLYLNILPLIGVHGLRHTHGSVLIHKGARLHYVSKRLGHSDIETTYKKYIHLLEESEEEDEKITTEEYEGLYD